ncbi:MAG: hypothetical protein HY011_09035 [Acidobacteria bacterium]|nr:hypothetical protein [Acidobacteriota bacterium]
MTHVVHQSTSQFTRAALCSLLLAAALASFTFAQTAPPAPQFFRVQVLKTNPGVSAEWQALYKNEVLPALKKAGVKQHTVLQVVQGDVRQWVIISAALENFAQLDEPTPLVKALGEEGARALNNKQGRLLAEWHSYVAQGRPDLGIAPTSNEPIKLASAISTTVTPGRAAEWEKYVKESNLPAAKKAGIKGVLVGKVAVGGDTNEYRTLLLFDSYADGFRFAQASSKAKAELNLATAAPAGVVAHSEMLTVRYVPELSIRPEAQK